MMRYLISSGAHAMDHIPGEAMPAAAKASHEVVHEAINAGVRVFSGGLENQKASIVATGATVTSGPYPQATGGLCAAGVPSRKEAPQWAAQTASACRCAVEVWEFMPGPETTRCSASSPSCPAIPAKVASPRCRITMHAAEHGDILICRDLAH